MHQDRRTKLDYGTIAVAAALVLDLAALPWVDVSIGPFSYSSSGVGSPDGALGALALVLAFAVGADVLLARVVPSLRLGVLETYGRGRVRLVASAAAGVLIALKLVLHLHPSYLGAGCWIALVLAASLVALSARLEATTEAPARRPSTTKGAASQARGGDG
jgi:hypothetical protein